MLSILIPIYNFDVRPFVRQIHRQILELNIHFEILCYDDFSDKNIKDKNKNISKLEGVRYYECPQNLGRSAIRNLMAQDAKYDTLLFLDNDGGIDRPDFIKKYIKNLQPNAIIYGGRIYPKERPLDARLYFHWLYGHKREALSCTLRKQKGYQSFMTNNFAVPKHIMLSFPFDEKLHGYGHEDTLFGQMMANENVPIIHIDNPVIHLGLESQATFIAKNKVAVRNLYHLYNLGLIKPKGIKLLEIYRLLDTLKLKKVALAILKISLKRINQCLEKPQAHFRCFDMYKLYLLLKLDTKKG